MFLIVRFQEHQLHDPGMNYQKHQHIDGPVPGVIELLLLNRPGDRTADRLSFQYLKGGDFIDAYNPDALLRQPCRIPIAPKDLLRSLFEPVIQMGRFPVTSAMGLQIDIVQDVLHGALANASDNSIGYGLPRQVLTRPMRDVQPFGHWFQARKFYDLRALHRVICRSLPE